MAKIKIFLGPESRGVVVDSFPFLPGLVFNRTPGTNKSQGLFNVTHVESGLFVLEKVEEGELEAVRGRLQGFSWEGSYREIAQSDEKYTAVMEVLALLDKREASDAQEKRIAKDLNGKQQPASGSRWGYRRDVITPEFLIEAKTTTTNSYAISDKDMEFLRKQAYSVGKIPAYVVELSGHPEVAVLPLQDVGEDVQVNKVVTLNRGRKSFKITPKAIRAVEESGGLIRFNSGVYVLLSYGNLLKIAKRGA